VCVLFCLVVIVCLCDYDYRTIKKKKKKERETLLVDDLLGDIASHPLIKKKVEEKTRKLIRAGTLPELKSNLVIGDDYDGVVLKFPLTLECVKDVIRTFKDGVPLHYAYAYQILTRVTNHI